MTEPRTAAGRALARYRTMNDGELDGYILAIEAEARAAALDAAYGAVNDLAGHMAIGSAHELLMRAALAAIDALREGADKP